MPLAQPGRGARLAYDDPDTLVEMHTDCRSVEAHLPGARSLAVAARAAAGPVPSLRHADVPREVTKRDIRVEEAAALLARVLHLELE